MDQKDSQEKDFHPNEQFINEIISHLSNVVLSNLKIYISEKFQELSHIFKDVEDTKLNVSTLSTVLFSKKIFTEKEFSECFREMVKSFGIADKDGNMSGTVVITDYNFNLDRGDQNESS